MGETFGTVYKAHRPGHRRVPNCCAKSVKPPSPQPNVATINPKRNGFEKQNDVYF